MTTSIKIKLGNNDFNALLKKYFDKKILTKSYKTGKYQHPFLGYNESGLPLVLFHNTPNNSLPLLWFNETYDIVGLFPRIDRHSE